jgi:hypothetical protein
MWLANKFNKRIILLAFLATSSAACSNETNERNPVANSPTSAYRYPRLLYYPPEKKSHLEFDDRYRWEILRSSAWEHKPITVVGTTKSRIHATLHTANYTGRKIGSDGQPNEEQIMQATMLSISENEKYTLVWAGYIFVNPEHPFTQYYHFIEVEGEFMSCFAPIIDINLTTSSVPTVGSKKKFEDDEFSLNRIMDEINQQRPKARPLISRYNIYRTFDRYSFFFSDRFYGSSSGMMACKSITAEGPIFCFEIENLSYPRRGKVWIDMKKRKFVRAVDLTDKEMLAKFPREMFWEES